MEQPITTTKEAGLTAINDMIEEGMIISNEVYTELLNTL